MPQEETRKENPNFEKQGGSADQSHCSQTHELSLTIQLRSRPRSAKRSKTTLCPRFPSPLVSK